MEELSLELSIGGKYGREENLKEKATEFCVADLSGVDSQRRREIQALRRREARRKREEKVKKSRGMNVVGFVEDKLFLEAQRCGARAGDRENREKDCFVEGRNGKNFGSDEVAGGLGLSLFSERKQRENECLYPKVQFESPCDSGYSNGVKSLEQCSSTLSDYHSMSHKGESSSDTGNHSSHLSHRQVDSLSQREADPCLKPAMVAPNPIANPQPNWMRSSDGSNANSSISPDATIVTSTSETLSKELNRNPPKPTNHGLNAASFPRMPCVSATGNGPNGRTVTGFLYRYNKTEVSIMCVCHGSSFTPAEFVEHAGGVDVAHPLRHITVIPFGPPAMR